VSTPRENYALLSDLRTGPLVSRNGSIDWLCVPRFKIRSFTQTYDNEEVKASLLQLPHAGFVEYDDPRMPATVAKIERGLQGDAGLLHRYGTGSCLDRLTGAEYPFPQAFSHLGLIRAADALRG
jgi:GH15 family glucan-1,4-alpha-glucosidase